MACAIRLMNEKISKMFTDTILNCLALNLFRKYI